MHTRPTLTKLALLVLLLLSLVACGGTPPPQPDPDGFATISGTVTLPPGATLALEGLDVLTPWGRSPVAADGSFQVELPEDQIAEVAEIGLEDEDGRLYLVGLTGGDTLQISAQSSALYLLYLALGGFTLPSEHQATLWALLEAEAGASASVAAELADLLRAGEAPLQAGSDALEGLLTAAREALLPTASALWRPAGPTSSLANGDPAQPPLQGGGAGNIVIEPGAGVLQGGASVLHNPTGSGIAVQNHQRRPLRLLAYQVGYRDADQLDHELSTPVLAGQLSAAATSRLSLFDALGDVVSGEAPWTPELSVGLPLPLYEGTQRTYYELVLLGPGFAGPGAPHADPRLEGQVEVWEQIVTNLALEQFLTEFVWPLFETYVLGKVVNVPAAEQRALREGFLTAVIPHMAGIGVYLSHRDRYAEGLQKAMDEIMDNRLLRESLWDLVRGALTTSQRNKLHLAAIEARLAVRASAAAITTAVSVVLASADVGAILHDLAASATSASWQATASPTLFFLTPEHGRFSSEAPQVELTVSSRGPTEGDHAYRWSTSGHHGDLLDGLQQGTAFDSHHANVWYTPRDPTHTDASQIDTVLVEVFEVPSAGAPIPEGAQPLARLTAQVQGATAFDSPVEGGWLELQRGSWTPPPTPYNPSPSLVECATLLLHIPKEAGAVQYFVDVSGSWGYGFGSHQNPNYDLRERGTPLTHAFLANGEVPAFAGLCQALTVADTWWLNDAGTEYLLGIYHLAWLPDTGTATQAEEAIELWVTWAAEGEIKVRYLK